MMKNWKLLSGILAIVIIFAVFFTFFFNKKNPEPPILPQKKAELPPPKPVEPPKKEVKEVKEEPKTKEIEKETAKEDKKQTIKEKKVPPQKPKTPVITPTPDAKAIKQPKMVDFDRLNREFNSYGLNVWATEFKNNEILLNGYVKNEKERSAALSIAGRYKKNITDMINVVEVYSIEESDSNRLRQPLPFSR